ncbi:MAG: hypothetical protein JSU58_01140 [Dehalococcoidales bacterium]|nr:MAG: hypothetical protein JSU58_01140 [Dehalococcoidales bacterium]
MKAYMIKSDKKIEPFGDHPQDCLIANKKLSDYQQDIFRELGLNLQMIEDDTAISDKEEYVIFSDSLYFNKDLLEDFISESQKLGRNTVCALKPGTFTLRTVVSTQEVTIYEDRIEYQLYYVYTNNQQGNRIPVIIDADTYHENLPMPEHFCSTLGYDIPMPDKMVIQIDHWTNLWAANIATLLAPAASLMKTPKWKLLGKAIKAGSLNQWKIISKMNSIGKNCDIHPTAYVEGSVIGDNVTIGAGSVVRESHIGNNVTVENNVTLNFTVVGEEGYIADGGTIRYSVIYPRFFGFCTISAQIIGSNCFIGDGVTLADYRLDGKCVTVVKNKVTVDTANRILGSCFGNDAYLASGTIVSPGRTIPNGTRVIPENLDIIQKITPDGIIINYRQVNDVTID